MGPENEKTSGKLSGTYSGKEKKGPQEVQRAVLSVLAGGRQDLELQVRATLLPSNIRIWTPRMLCYSVIALESLSG